MKLQELFEVQVFHSPNNRKRYDKRRDVRRRATTFNVIDANGQIIASGLTPQGAQLMSRDPEMIKKYGKLYTRNILYRE